MQRMDALSKDLGALTVPEKFQYEPLTHEIRLLDLHPSTDTASPIQCTLRKAPLLGIAASMANPEEEKSFEALSYTWGDPMLQDALILVNKQPFKVTQNLESFLRQRRETSQLVTLWVDAVCINQHDVEEKNQQIPLMNLIYAMAQRLTVWLGPASHDSACAMECLHNLGSTSPYGKMALLDERSKVAVQSLLSRPWWTRVWIIQELAMGGMGIKMNKVQVCCGEKTVPWMAFVVAAARMQAYHADLRQPFPNVTNILELDSLRETAYRYIVPELSSPLDREFILGLLCRYRHFLATNPRDKLYAIHNIFSRLSSQMLTARYDAPVRDVYLAFALGELADGATALEILRQCGPSANKLPSWVPDWSVPLGCLPLPAKRIRRYFDVPWWAEPEEVEPHQIRSDSTIKDSQVRFAITPLPRDREVFEHQRRMRLRRLEIGAEGFGIVEDFAEIPPNFSFHNMMPNDESKEMMATMVANKMIVLAVSDQRLFREDALVSQDRDAVKEGEIITERRMKRWLLGELQDSKSRTPYQAAGYTECDISIDEKRGILNAQGLLLDTIDVCQEPFVDDVETDWKSATRFMVAVGNCKKMALDHGSVAARYPHRAELVEAFWKTLFVSQVARPDNFETDGVEEKLLEKLQYTDWLPEVPPGWSVTEPAITATTAGLVELAEVNLAADVAQTHLKGPFLEVFSDTEAMPTPSHPDFSPQDWTDEAKQQHKSDLQELASLWQQQPFDLYHRPFSFLYVIPDPYWETRKTQDELALQSTKKWRSRVLISISPEEKTEESQEEDAQGNTKKSKSRLEAFHEYAERHHQVMTETPSLVPQSTLEPGLEKYALGRKFFITEKGYMGLGPKDLEPGDTVAILFGSNVPFLLRKNTKAEEETWRLLGECYLQDLMSGEFVENPDLGTAGQLISIA